MLFLTNESSDSFHKNYPHDEYRLVHNFTGKKNIVDDAVRFSFMRYFLRKDYNTISVKFPLELAVKFAKAFVKDREATLPLVDEIISLATGKKRCSAGRSRSPFTCKVKRDY